MNTPHLVQVLANEYYEAQKTAGATDDQAMQIMDRVKPFLEFCREYLINNRPATLSHSASNYQVTLTNGKSFYVCPDLEEVKGTMQPYSAVMVSTGQGAQGTGMVDMSYVGLGMQPHIVAPQVQRVMETQRDLTQSSGVVDFTKPGAQMPRY